MDGDNIKKADVGLGVITRNENVESDFSDESRKPRT